MPRIRRSPSSSRSGSGRSVSGSPLAPSIARPTAERRRDSMAAMQQLFYDEAPYQVLYYSDELHVYWTDKFGGWQNQPVDSGTPFFVNGSINYQKLPLASAAAPSASAAPSAAPTA